MSRFPDPSAELAELQAFLAKSEAIQAKPEIAEMRTKTERLRG